MQQVNDYTQKAVLCFIIKDGQILLIEKLRGLGMGKINGPGGKCEPGEEFVEAAIRETIEEVLVEPKSLRRLAQLGFRFSDGFSIYVEAFVATDFSGIPGSTDEAIPVWYPLDRIPYQRMWADDILWLPLVLKGQTVQGIFDFDGDRLLDYQISLTPTFFAQ